jgi:hypothetical protein
MVNLVRSAKSGSDWTRFDLAAYNISIVEQDQDIFFGGSLPPYTGPVGFVQHEARVHGLDLPSLALIKRLRLAMRLIEGEESCVDDFTAGILRALGYETEETVVLSQKNIRLYMCGKTVYTKTDVCILDDSFEILLLAQEDKSHICESDPEAQLVAEAVAAFQANNEIRVNERFVQPLQRYVFPGITMVGTFPRFYKIAVTADLDQAIRYGDYPPTETIVYRHTPRVPGGRNEGMKPLMNRQLIMQCYEAFKGFVFPKEGACPSYD